MANIELKIVALGDFSSVNTQIKALQAQVELLQKSVAGVGLNPQLTSQLKSIQSEFNAALMSSGNFVKSTVQLTSETEKFGKALQSGKLSLGQYFGIITGRSAEAKKAVEALAVEQVKLNNSIVQQDITKQGVYSVYTPTKINEIAKATEIAAAKQNIYNLAVREGSTQLINFGKNTQWAGRQLTVGLAMPMLLFGSQAVKTFQDVNTELVRLQKVYGTGLIQPTKQALTDISNQVTKLSQDLASSMGIAAKDTAAMAADIAATGKTGNDLIVATREAMRLSKLGEMSTQDAMQTTISLQNVYKLNTNELSGAINFLNAVENQTSTSLQDLAAGIPKVGPIVQQLGGSFKDTAVMMVAMKEAGVPAAQSANAIKSAIASMINPTKAAKEAFRGFGIDLGGIATSTGGNPIKMILSLQSALKGIAPLAQAQLIEKLFGKFQEARIQALITNLGAVNSQTRAAFDLANASAPQLAAMAANELKIANESVTGKWKRAIETLKADLLPIGQKIMQVGTDIVNFGAKIADFFNKLPGPIKNGLGILLTLGVISGPIIMITGLLANLVGQGMKVGYSLLGVINGTRKWKDLMTPTSIAAKTATEVFNEGLLTNLASIDQLNSALQRMIANLEAINMAKMSTAGGVLGSVEKTVGTSGIIGAVERAAVRSAEQLILPGMATGGYVPGNPANGDAYPALLMGGEAVIPTEQARRYAPFINAMIDGKLPGHEDGLRARLRQQYGGVFNYLSASGNIRRYADREFAHLDAPVNNPDGSSVENAKGAFYHREINQGTNSGMSARDLYDYIKGVVMSVGNGGRLMPNLKIVNPQGDPVLRQIQHNQELAYGPMATTAGITDPKQRQSFYDEIDNRVKAWLKPLAESGKEIKDVAGAGQIGATHIGQIVNDVLRQQSYGQSANAIAQLEAPLETRTTGKGGSGRTRSFISGDTRISGIIAKTLGGKSITKTQENEIYNSGIILGDSLDKGARSREGLDEHSNSRKAIKTAKEYIGGLKQGVEESAPGLWTEGKGVVSKLHDGVDEGLNGSTGTSKIQGIFNKAFGSGGKLSGIMSKFSGMGMMGRMGIGMGMGMVTQMASPLINKLPGGNLIADALSGASMGAGFGPWGMAAGAALSLVTGGIKELMAAEKLHAAESKADFTSSASAIKLMGGNVVDTTTALHDFSVVNVSAVYPALKNTAEAATKVAKGILYTTTELDAFKKSVAGLPKDDPLSLLIKQISGANPENAAKWANTFVTTQMAINNLSLPEAQKLQQLILTMSGQNPSIGLPLVTNQIDAVKAATIAALPSTSQFSAILGQLVMAAANTSNLKNYQTQIALIGAAAGTSAQQLAGLFNYFSKLPGDTNSKVAGLISNMQSSGKGFTAQDVAAAVVALNNGKTINFDQLNPGQVEKQLGDPFAGISKERKAALIEQAALTKKLTDAQNGSNVAAAGAAAATKANLPYLEKQQRLLEARLKSLQDLQRQESQNTSYATTKEDLKNQILMAQSTGDNLKAQLLKQQLLGTTRDFTLQNQINAAQQSVDKNRVSLDEASLAVQKAQTNATNGNSKLIETLTASLDALNTRIANLPGGSVVYGPTSGQTTPQAKVANAKAPNAGDQVYDPKTHTLKTAGYAPGQVAPKNPTVPMPQVRANGKPSYPENHPHPLAPKKKDGSPLHNYALTKLPIPYNMIRYYDKKSGYSWDPVSGLVLDNNMKPIDLWAGSDSEGIVRGFARGGVARTNSGITYHRQHMNRQSRNFDTGGGVRGPGTGTSDSIPAMLSNGEYVIKADSVSHYGARLFDSLNAKKFAKGGKANTGHLWDDEWKGIKAGSDFLGITSLINILRRKGKKSDVLSAAALIPGGKLLKGAEKLPEIESAVTELFHGSLNDIKVGDKLVPHQSGLSYASTDVNYISDLLQGYLLDQGQTAKFGNLYKVRPLLNDSTLKTAGSLATSKQGFEVIEKVASILKPSSMSEYERVKTKRELGLIPSVSVPQLPTFPSLSSLPPRSGIATGGYIDNGKVRLPSFDIGTNFVPHDMIAQIHKGERIIPASQNNGTMGSTYNITVNAGSNASAEDIAKTVMNTIKRQEAMSGRKSLVGN